MPNSLLSPAMAGKIFFWFRPARVMDSSIQQLWGKFWQIEFLPLNSQKPTDLSLPYQLNGENPTFGDSNTQVIKWQKNAELP
jgi:hypothetical protein